MVKEYIPEFDATVKYEKFDKCKINGVEHVYIFHAVSGIYEWVESDYLKINLTECKLMEKPSLINMLKEFASTYDRQPNKMEERFLVERFKAEFNHWSKNNV